MEKNKKQANKAKSKEKAAKVKSESKESGKGVKRAGAPSGYLLYSKDFREKRKDQKFSMKEVAETWKNLNESERAKWNDQSAKLKSAIATNDDEKPNKKADKKAAAKAPKDNDKNDKKKRSVSKNKKKQEEESDQESEEDDD